MARADLSPGRAIDLHPSRGWRRGVLGCFARRLPSSFLPSFLLRLGAVPPTAATAPCLACAGVAATDRASRAASPLPSRFVYPLRTTKPTSSQLSFPIHGRPGPTRVPALRDSSFSNKPPGSRQPPPPPYPCGEERMRSGVIETKWLAAPWREASGRGPPSPGERGVCGSAFSPPRQPPGQPCPRQSRSELQIW